MSLSPGSVRVLAAVWLFALGPFVARSAVLESRRLMFELEGASGAWSLLDRSTGVRWTSNRGAARFGEVTLRTGGASPRTLPLVPEKVSGDRRRLILEFRPVPVPGQADAVLRVEAGLARDGEAVEFRYEADPVLGVEAIRLLDEALAVGAGEAGYLVVPTREGLLIPADGGRTFTHRFDTYAYEGCHLQMFGAVKRGAAVLVTWDDPYVALDVRGVSAAEAGAGTGGASGLAGSLVLRKSARSVCLRVLGGGDYLTIARAYREVARERGLVVGWDRKIRENPERAKYLGASNYKLWSVLDRRMDEASAQEKSVRLNWTFGEAAQVAEHLRRDLQMEKVLFSMGGWIHRGYDNQHPDILPAAPECGGNDGLADCARRVMALGYVFSLHDNYQDIYRDSPSWDERWVNKNPDGSLTQGGVWAGGRAYITCARMAYELARRPQNLEAVRQLTGANSYFIDTTYAAGLYECQDPVHPMTRADDLRWKVALSDYARQVFGTFGSECGREWALPHADFFEGLTGVSGRAFHDVGLLKKVGGAVIPFFELVYRDGIALYGKYGYDPAQAGDYVRQHLAFGRPLHYHNVPPHLYWQKPGPPAPASTPGPGRDPGIFQRGDGGWTEGLHSFDRFVKNTHEILSPLHELTARLPLTRHAFLDPARAVQVSVFGDGKRRYEVVVNGADSVLRRSTALGGSVELPPGGFVVEGPQFAAFLATEWGGGRYAGPVLFTLRSADGRDLARSRSVRVFHGFGDPQLTFRGREWSVPREALLEP